MFVEHGNYFDIVQDCEYECVTTNGITYEVEPYEFLGVEYKNNLVMGGGIALAYAQQFPFLQGYFGDRVKKYGNHVYLNQEYQIFSFPTKNHYKDPSSLKLIEQSAQEIAIIARALNLHAIAIPAPGCGLGGLKFEQVQPILEEYLDDRFTVVV